jgi:hypothetical protein
MQRAVILQPDDVAERPALLQELRDASWMVEPLGDLAVLVSLPPEATGVDQGEEALLRTLRAAGHVPRWATVSDHATGLAASSDLTEDAVSPEEGD